MSVNKHLCGPCFDENTEKEGVVYCSDCEKPLCDTCKQDHARIKVSKHHKLCDLADVPPQEIQDLLKNLTACPNHEKEEVVYLCRDHDVTCCSKCAMADHRKCEEVKVLSDIIHSINGDLSGLKIVLHDLQKSGERLLEHENKHEKVLYETERQASILLQDIKKKLLDMYDQLEKEVLSAIADKKKVICENIETQNKMLHQFLNDIKQQSSYIEDVEKFETNEHSVLVERKIERESVCRLKSTVAKLENTQSKSSFKYIESTCFDSLLIEMRNAVQIEDVVCGVSETGSDTDISHSRPFTERMPKLQRAIDLCKMQLTDNEVCRPDACIWIDKCIIISLEALDALVVVDEDNTTVLSKFKCQSKPWSVSKTGPSDMVISLPYVCKIAFAQLRHGNVHVVTELTTRVPYHDVSRDTSSKQYICISNNNGQIDILNNDGTLLRGISLSSEIVEYLKSSAMNHVAFSSTNCIVYISIFSPGMIIAINLNGEKIFYYKHKDVNLPEQCIVDPRGNVYVISFENNVHQIGPTGQHIRSLLSGKIQRPTCICFNNTFDKLAIGGGITDEYLRVYTYI